MALSPLDVQSIRQALSRNLPDITPVDLARVRNGNVVFVSWLQIWAVNLVAFLL